MGQFKAMDDFSTRCNAIEESYEFMLGYAGQGLSGDESNPSSDRAREYLQQAAQALSGLTEACATAVKQEDLERSETYQSFLDVLDRDALSSLAAVQIVLAQRRLSSQLIDNLNASVHLRALLTDLFLIDEIMKVRHIPPKTAALGVVLGDENK